MKNREQTFVEGARRSPGADDEILKRRISELGLKLEGSVLETLLRQLERELVEKGIAKVKPRAYLTDEWGCPEGVPIIGIPYYLADERLKEAADEVVEGETEAEILRYLRHEMGHVFNYAYRLYTREDWTELFGSYARPYVENYTPRPFSRDYVRHIAGWYAQKHPDEDWSESFAVWLTPGSDWSKIYGAKALKKLQYVERIVKELGDRDPDVPQPGGASAEIGSLETLTYTVGEHIEKYREPNVEVPPFFDGDLRDLFDGRPERQDAEPAGDFLARHRKAIVKRVAHWTGVREGIVGSLVDHLIDRSKALGLLAERRRTARRLIDIIAYCTTLTMNFLYQGSFIPGSPAPDPVPIVEKVVEKKPE
ncbi:MAG TPA: putative zinc-binding metallopeptidase [Planctomycetota bacterium]|nr:putative zinc-binding metallopeptidase [Planctomycetota bacterium]